jgi:hypothetical protein
LQIPNRQWQIAWLIVQELEGRRFGIRRYICQNGKRSMNNFVFHVIPTKIIHNRIASGKFTSTRVCIDHPRTGPMGYESSRWKYVWVQEHGPPLAKTDLTSAVQCPTCLTYTDIIYWHHILAQICRSRIESQDNLIAAKRRIME